MELAAKRFADTVAPYVPTGGNGPRRGVYDVKPWLYF